ncbi:hypothetical protein ES703_94266 [subsurface metagenome]
MDWGLIGIVLAVIFFSTTVILTLKYRRVKKLVWSYTTKKVIGLGSDTPPELQLIFGEQRVSDVYRTTMIVFNAGNDSLRKDDVTKDVTVHFRGAKILRPPTNIVKSKEAIQFTVIAVNDNDGFSVKFDFLYLDHNDGAVVEILHTKSEVLSCSGNIIGVKQIKYREDFRPRRLSFRKSFQWRDIFSAPVITLIFLGSVLLITSLLAGKSIGSLWEEYSIVFSLLGGMIIGSLFGWLVTSFPLLSSFPKWSVIKD